MDRLQASIGDLANTFANSSEERLMLGIAEEAGEVTGTYNKMCDRRTDKPKTMTNVIEEMAQLIGCVFLAADRFGYSYYEVLTETNKWLIRKRQEIEATRVALKPRG